MNTSENNEGLTLDVSLTNHVIQCSKIFSLVCLTNIKILLIYLPLSANTIFSWITSSDELV